jgi:hypothetical protein
VFSGVRPACPSLSLMPPFFWRYTAPWDLYHASRTRRILAAGIVKDDVAPEVARRRREAMTELKFQELFSLSFTVLSPLIGAYLLYGMRGALSEPDRYINPFSIRLFVLSSGVKPWMHLFRLLRQRSLFLQDMVHYPLSEVKLLRRKVERLESQLTQLSRAVVTKDEVDHMRQDLDVPLDKLSKTIKRYGQKEESSRLSIEERFNLVDDRLADVITELAMSAELVDQLQKQASQSRVLNSLYGILHVLGQRWMAAGGRGGRLPLAQSGSRWYERGPLFYLFLPVNLSNRALDSIGHIASKLEGRTHQHHPLLTAVAPAENGERGKDSVSVRRLRASSP